MKYLLPLLITILLLGGLYNLGDKVEQNQILGALPLIRTEQGGTATNTSAWTGFTYITAGVWGTSSSAETDPIWAASSTAYSTKVFNTQNYISSSTIRATYMTNFATSIFMTNFATSVFALDTDITNMATTGYLGFSWASTAYTWATTTAAKFGTLTNTKWCSSDGTVINCTEDTPAGGSGGAWSTSTDLLYTTEMVLIGASATSGAGTNVGLELGGSRNMEFATDGDAYVYFNAGVDYMLWDDGSPAFFFTDNITTNDTITGINITAASSTLWSYAYAAASTAQAWNASTNTNAWNWATQSMAWHTGTTTNLVASSTWWDKALSYATSVKTYVDASSSNWNSAYSYLFASSSNWNTAYNSTLSLNASSTWWDKAFLYSTNTAIYLTQNYIASSTIRTTYMTTFATSIFMTTFDTSTFALDTDLTKYMTNFDTSTFALDTDLANYMTNFATSVFALDTDLTNMATTGTFTAGDYITLTGTDFDLDAEVYTKTGTMVFQNCTTTTKYATAALKAPKASTILEIGCSTDSGSSTIKSWEGTTAYASSSSIVEALICTAGAGATTTTFVDSAIAKDAFIGVTLTAISGATNTTAWITYKPND